MSQAKEGQRRLRRLVAVLMTSELMTETLPTWTVPRRLPWNEFLAFDTRFVSGKMNVVFDGHAGLLMATTVLIATTVTMATMVTMTTTAAIAMTTTAAPMAIAGFLF